MKHLGHILKDILWIVLFGDREQGLKTIRKCSKEVVKGQNCSNHIGEISEKRMDWNKVFGNRKAEIGKFVFDDETGKFVPFAERKKPKKKGFLIGLRSHLPVPTIEYYGKDSARSEKLCSGIVYR